MKDPALVHHDLYSSQDILDIPVSAPVVAHVEEQHSEAGTPSRTDKRLPWVQAVTDDYNNHRNHLVSHGTFPVPGDEQGTFPLLSEVGTLHHAKKGYNTPLVVASIPLLQRVQRIVLVRLCILEIFREGNEHGRVAVR